MNGGILQSVNDSTTLLAPAGAIDQLGHSLEHIIHAFVEAGGDDKIFMAISMILRMDSGKCNVRRGRSGTLLIFSPTGGQTGKVSGTGVASNGVG